MLKTINNTQLTGLNILNLMLLHANQLNTKYECTATEIFLQNCFK